MARGKKAGPPVMPYDEPSVEAQTTQTEETMSTASAETEHREPRMRSSAPIKRMSLNLNEDNTIAWDRLRESNREEVKKIVTGWMNDPKMLGVLGIEKPLVQVFSPSWCDTIYDTIGNLEVMLAPKMFGVTLEQAAILRYSPAEKDQLREPTARVINKYLPLWLAKFEDEIKLAMLLVSISFVKVQMLRAIAAMPKVTTQTRTGSNGAETPTVTFVAQEPATT